MREDRRKGIAYGTQVHRFCPSPPDLGLAGASEHGRSPDFSIDPEVDRPV
jgi:hypothetical protein